MFFEIIPIVAPIFICAGVGFFWHRLGYEYPSDFIGRLVTNVGAPCLIFYSLTSKPLPFSALIDVGLVASTVFFITLVVAGLLLYWLRISIPTYLPPFLFPNSGNMGLPLCFFAFGDEGLTLALGYFIFMMMAQLTLGFIILQGPGSAKTVIASLAKNPMILALVVALITAWQGWLLPLWLENSVELLSSFTIPLMLITLGVSLASLHVQRWKRPLGLSLIRALLSLTVAWVTCIILDLSGAVKGVAILQAAMPAAVFNYLFSIRFQREPEEVAGFVIVSTLISILLLPFVLYYVVQQG